MIDFIRLYVHTCLSHCRYATVRSLGLAETEEKMY